MSDLERQDLIDTLAKHRDLLLVPVLGVDDETARTRHCVSALTLGGLVKHVAATVRQWADFVRHGAPVTDGPPVDWADIDWADPPPAVRAHLDAHTMREEETLDALVEELHAACADLEDLARSVDLDEAHELPVAPWFEPGARWTNRRVLVHLVAEIAQHAGHADIVRESYDGQRSMG